MVIKIAMKIYICLTSSGQSRITISPDLGKVMQGHAK